jgi:hypothetical protein
MFLIVSKKPMSLEDFVRGAAAQPVEENADAAAAAAVPADVDETSAVPVESNESMTTTTTTNEIVADIVAETTTTATTTTEVDSKDVANNVAVSTTTPSKPKIPLSELKKTLSDADVASLRKVRRRFFFFFFFFSDFAPVLLVVGCRHAQGQTRRYYCRFFRR